MPTARQPVRWPRILGVQVPAVARKQLPLRPAGPDTVAALLDWYDREHRDLPWRASPGKRANPYKVWLSEIMLQQTTVAAVRDYYAKFLRLWPDVAELAAARRNYARFLLTQAALGEAGSRYVQRARRRLAEIWEMEFERKSGGLANVVDLAEPKEFFDERR